METKLNAHSPDVTASPPPYDDEKKTSIQSQGNTDLVEEKESGERRIGKWFIKETLGKGGYSWVKRGVDSTTQIEYALKFMERRKDSGGNIRKSQIKQVETEIAVLRRVGTNANIIRLFAYNLNQKYPDRNGSEREVILLVLEYCPGGELFDLLYYTEHLDALLARTYFHALCSGIKCLHSLGIIHRDIKPQNLLLDRNYNLKITDFGLSKMINLRDPRIEGDISRVRLLDPRVGTKGYQSPEIVCMNKYVSRKKKPPSNMYYNNNCDIFAMGVVLFILMTGYPPFKSADPNDKWYYYISKGDYQSFWKAHRNSGLKKSETDLITRMLLSDISERIGMNKIEQHAWYLGEILTSKELRLVLEYRHQEMELKRSMDNNKQAILQYSEKVVIKKPLLPYFKNKILGKGYKLNKHPPALCNAINMARSVYTSCNAYQVLQEIKVVIEDDMRGILIDPKCNQIFENLNSNSNVSIDNENIENIENIEKGDIDIDNFCLMANIAHLKDDEDNDEIEFEGTKIHVQIYWHEIKQCNLVQFNIISNDYNNQNPNNENTSFMHRKNEIEKWKKLKNAFLTKAGHVLTGLPQKQKYVDDHVKQLYKKCFPHKVIQKD